MRKNSWKILIVDDDDAARKMLTLSLQEDGYIVVNASDGEQGLRACAEQAPQIIITDIRMPGIDGIEVLRRIKEAHPDKEVIVITAFGETDLAIRALQLGASDFLTKPVRNDALIVAIERARHRYTSRKDLNDYTELIENRWIETSEQLAKTFLFQKNLIESSIDGIIACDEQERVIVFNLSMQQILGYDKDEVIGKKLLHEFFGPGEAEKFHSSLYSDAYGGKNRLFLFDMHMVDKTGTRIPGQMSASVLFEDDRQVGVVGFFRDLREVRRLMEQVADQARFLHQDKMISLGKLAASVVHEINNPLAGILIYNRLMLKILAKGDSMPESAEKFRSYLSIMESELGRCTDIVSNLLFLLQEIGAETCGRGHK